jgi:uncharacterized CHY-type Zn-finger protein
MTAKIHFTPDYMVCPTCMELLTREDVEAFGKCPYCNHRIEHNHELEDFLLQPVVNYWMKQVQPQENNITLD